MTPPDDPLLAAQSILPDGVEALPIEGLESRARAVFTTRSIAGYEALIADLFVALRAAALQQPARSEGLDVERLTLALLRVALREDGIPTSRWDLYAGTVAADIAREYAALALLSPDTGATTGGES